MERMKNIIERLKKAGGIKTPPKLDGRLANMERVFHAPPLTPEMVAAIKLISPHFDFSTGENYRDIWEADQNGACWGEFEALQPLFRAMTKPLKILEIGPGMGRSLVFFSKKLGWETAEIHAYEGDGEKTKYDMLGPRSDESFCGNISILRQMLDFNKIQNVEIFNSSEISLAKLPGGYDLLYSFYSIGFHWSLEHFLDDLMPLLSNSGIAVFTIAPQFTPFAKLERLPFRIIDWKTAYPKNGKLRMLVVGKNELPEW